MSLKSRLANVQIIDNAVSMYSVEGARFQEDCLKHVTPSNKSVLVNSGLIGELVTAINNNRLTVAEAQRQFNNALFADFR